MRALCTERNALLMLDEVQTGLGRTGHWFAFQAQGLEPDVVTMAKALGNGMPVGACWARAEVAAAFGPGDHGSTFGGQPLAPGRGQGHAGRDGVRGRLPPGPRGRARGWRPGWPDCRAWCRCAGAGLLLAAQLDGAGGQGGRGAGALARGLLVNAVRPDAIRVAPPLLVSDDEIDAALRILAEVLADARRGAPAAPGRSGPTRCQISSISTTSTPTRGTACSSWRSTSRREPRARAGQGVALLFEKPSARTRNSTEMAVVDLAGTRSTSRAPRSASTCARRPRTWPARLACYHRVVVRPGLRPRTSSCGWRPPSSRSGFDVPVVNLLSDRAHPCQAHGRRRSPCARPSGRWPGRVLTYVGDANNVARSLAKAALLEGMEVRIASPGRLRVRGRRAGGLQAFADADRARWHRAADRRPRRGGQGRRRALHRRVDEHGPGGGAGAAAGGLRGLHRRRRRWSTGPPTMPIVLHCLPAHRGEEITDAVLEGPRSLVWRQAAHRRTAMRGDPGVGHGGRVMSGHAPAA